MRVATVVNHDIEAFILTMVATVSRLKMLLKDKKARLRRQRVQAGWKYDSR